MCGIFGYASWGRDGDRDRPSAAVLCRATNLLRHRGPDGGAYWHDGNIFLGHRRLAIIDLATGDQPMLSADGRYVVVFNGEIYNYRELRDELRREGGGFRTASDTEVILAGYAAWGTGMVARLEGMFAFGLYDRQTRTLLLARDRFGEKPLLVAETDGGVAFASELAPLAALGLCRRGIDVEALGGYLVLNYVPGQRTLANGIRRVAPGEWQLYGAHGLERHARYWSPAEIVGTTEHVREGDLVDELQRRVDDAVRLALRSDVPVGVFLSGGVDSSVIAESAARLGNLEAAFCVDFADEGFSEWPRASQVASKLKIELVRVPIHADVLGEFLDVTRHLDDPLADSSAMAVWTVARAASQRLKVVLSGDGGDEIFGGYLTYPASQWHARLRPALPAAAWSWLAAAAGRAPVDQRVKVGRGYKLQRFLRAMPLPTAEAHFTWNGTWLPRHAAALVRSDAARGAASDALSNLARGHGLGSRPSLQQLQLADLTDYLPNDILAKVDRATMAHGLESRAPFLNSGVASMALTLPDRYRVSRSARTKVLLRELCARHFGAAHANAPKQGFSLPIHSWLRQQGRHLVTTWLARDRVDATGVLDTAAVDRAVGDHLSGRVALGWELWGLMVLVAWYEQRVASPPDLDAGDDSSDLRHVDTLSPAAAR
jgi:asparagine synthase (glutamine-hydrolysing)